MTMCGAPYYNIYGFIGIRKNMLCVTRCGSMSDDKRELWQVLQKSGGNGS